MQPFFSTRCYVSIETATRYGNPKYHVYENGRIYENGHVYESACAANPYPLCRIYDKGVHNRVSNPAYVMHTSLRHAQEYQALKAPEKESAFFCDYCLSANCRRNRNTMPTPRQTFANGYKNELLSENYARLLSSSKAMPAAMSTKNGNKPSRSTAFYGKNGWVSEKIAKTGRICQFTNPDSAAI